MFDTEISKRVQTPRGPLPGHTIYKFDVFDRVGMHPNIPQNPQYPYNPQYAQPLDPSSNFLRP